MADNKTMTEGAVAAVSIPITSRQAFKIMDEMLSDEDILAALSHTKEEFASFEHFGLGLWIRNNWIYGEEDEGECFKQRREACILMLTGKKDAELYIINPDMVSYDFLRRYYDHLKRKARKAKC